MRRMRTMVVIVSTPLLMAACGSSSGSSSSAATTSPATTAPATTVPATTAAPTTEAPTTVTPTTVTPSPTVAIWPAAGVVMSTPEQAAKDFLAHAFGDGPMIGAYQAGDARSGEFSVFASVDGTPLTNVRSTLLVRQLGPSNGWFVLAAVNDAVTITSPSAGSTVAAASIDVEGKARGFEANIGAVAFVVGRADHPLDRQSTMAGNEQPAPYRVALDLRAATPGDVVVILVHGGVGLETDPGEFSALPVVIGR